MEKTIRDTNQNRGENANYRRKTTKQQKYCRATKRNNIRQTKMFVFFLKLTQHKKKPLY